MDLDPCTLLRQADQAWFELSTGASLRSVRDQNGEEVQYSTANRAGLLNLIATLQSQCSTYKSVALGKCPNHPMGFLF